MTKQANNVRTLPVTPVAPTPAPAPAPALSIEEQLKALLAQVDAKTVKSLLKSVEENKPTLLSVTMDAIVACEDGAMLSADVTKTVTTNARACNILKADEDANATNVAQLIRYVKAFDSAVHRAFGCSVADAVAAWVAANPAQEPAAAPSAPQEAPSAPQEDVTGTPGTPAYADANATA